MYNRTVLDHFTHPRNVGTIENADGHARVKSDIHDDEIDLYIRVQDDRIAEVKYRTFGCVAVIAASSMASELMTGMALEDAATFSQEQVAEALGGLPQGKVQCSVLAPAALRLALADYRRKQSAVQGGS